MSEFKFACPVCGQHITADSTTTGAQLECPTCFQKIIVPQAPASDSPKFILAASQVAKPREVSNGLGGGPLTTSPAGRPLSIAAFLLVLICAGAAAFVFRGKIFHTGRQPGHASAPGEEEGKTREHGSVTPKTVYPIPTNIQWSLELTNAIVPEALAAGRIHGSGFLCERATLQGGNLTLRQGKTGPADLGVSVYLFAQQGEELSGKSVEVAADRPPPLPRVVLRWKDDQDKAVTKNFNAGGYALKLEFGEAALGRIAGKIYLGLPDENKSFVAGTFEAQIRKPNPPKQRPPKLPKPPQ